MLRRFLRVTISPLVRYKSDIANSGVLGTNRHFPKNEDVMTTSISLTNPYLIYKSLLINGEIDSDPFQLALIKKLGKISTKLQDYQPDLTNVKINRLVRELEIKYNQQQRDDNGVLFGYTIGWFKERENNKLRTQLVKVLNDYEELTSDSMKFIPMGLLINGEVGCGKTMLMDIFADSLPINGKWRIHWSVFIQWVMKEIESISTRKRDNFMQANHPLLNFENEFILFEVAARLIEKCHVLILDEFMLPDIASAKIVNILFVYYFKLGGVLIASSNRLPEELYSGSINKKSIGSFEQILRARCEVWDMQSNKDYRTELKEDDIATDEEKWIIINNDSNSISKWSNLLKKVIGDKKCEENFTTFTSYGRDVIIPKSYGNNDIAYFKFEDIIKDSTYGPGDFISIATKYPMIIIDNVPILSIKMKNHARRLITFIDAIYDSKCNLIIRVETEPHNLFFPDVREDLTPTRFQCTPLEDGPNPICLNEAMKGTRSSSNAEEVQDLEMFAKTEMDMSNPYRPNFATYEDTNKEYKIENNDDDDDDESKKNFTDMKKFTGEDEMFAYKRAVSRINEMTHSLRWRNNAWVPLHDSIKQWEKPADKTSTGKTTTTARASNPTPAFTQEEKPLAPQFGEYNFWSMGQWKHKGSKLKDEIAKKWIEGAK